MSRAEALLKVILPPIDSVADTYRALFPEGTPMEFQRILELKGIKKADQQSILDDFNKHGPGFIQPSVAPLAPQLAITNPATTAGFIANSEDVLTRAAALGRGAATTGFKKFIALTEAAKDRKDLGAILILGFLYSPPSLMRGTSASNDPNQGTGICENRNS